MRILFVTLLAVLLSPILTLAQLGSDVPTAPTIAAQEDSETICTSGDLLTCQQITEGYLRGVAPLPQDLDQLEPYLERSLELSADGCRNGSVGHCDNLIRMHRFGAKFSSLKDKYQLFDYLTFAALESEKQCFSGSFDACKIALEAYFRIKKVCRTQIFLFVRVSTKMLFLIKVTS